MERKTRNERRNDCDYVATSDYVRVLRRQTSSRFLLAALLTGVLFVPSVGCNAWRAIGRVDSPRGEYFLNDADAEEIWRDSKPESLSDSSSVRGKEIETYDAASDVYEQEKKSEASFSERFKHMFRKPKYSAPVPERRTSTDGGLKDDATKYVKDDESVSASRASLSGKPENAGASKESFWSKFFWSSKNVSPEIEPEIKLEKSIEKRAGGLAKDNLEKTANNESSAKSPAQQIRVRRRWSSRDERKAESAVVAKPRNDAGALLIRQYDSQRFLPPFDVIEEYYYPSGAVETTTKVEQNAQHTESGTAPNDSVARGAYRTSSYAPTDRPVAQVSYYQPQNAGSVYAAHASQIQRRETNGTTQNSNTDDLLERRREFDWFDFAPGSLTSSEQAEDASFDSKSKETEGTFSKNAHELYEGKNVGYRSADDILDESARRQSAADNYGASKCVSFETPTSERVATSSASSIGVDVFGASVSTPSCDVSALVDQALETSGATAAVNSLDERKSENASSPLTREEVEWVKHVEDAISGLLAERAELKKRGEDTSLCDARLRLLYLVVGEYDRQIQEIVDSGDPLKLFWEKECDGLKTLLQNKLEEIDPEFVAETLMSGLDSFFDVCDVQIRKALLVDTPACFGLFEERVKPYRPGEVVYAYAELDYVVNKETTRGNEIAVECRWRLLDSNGNALTEFKTQRCENVAETRLRDVVLNVAVPLSDEIAPNDYILELEVVDLNADESVATTRRLNVKVAANSAPGARG